MLEMLFRTLLFKNGASELVSDKKPSHTEVASLHFQNSAEDWEGKPVKKVAHKSLRWHQVRQNDIINARIKLYRMSLKPMILLAFFGKCRIIYKR